ncbi:hypothetical protein Tco_1275259 [Tanacetum coccineum]
MITNQPPIASELELPAQLEIPQSQNRHVCSTGDGTVKGIIGDEMGDGSSDGDEEMGSEPDVYSSEGGVCTLWCRDIAATLSWRHTSLRGPDDSHSGMRTEAIRAVPP